MEYGIDREALLNRLAAWDGFLKRRVHLIACGGTALTLLGLKVSTKDVDLLIPNIDEYEYLTGILKQLGYKPASGAGWKTDQRFIFDLFKGKAVHTTELLESPLDKGNNIPVKEFSRIYLGILNYYDIIISKLFRATTVDIDDCLLLIKSRRKELDFKRLEKRFRETAAFDVSEERVNKHFDSFVNVLRKKGLLDGK
ncbi:MAG: hypothetical protein KKI13_05175 [Candidatus Omnitrophica bacterium]|nr:hypothetical protein [Candidatus Omnitrophota bacterium]